ncbi:MAG TPA: TonB-dependent receptor, partial [Bacteroidia bacterium]
GNNNKTVNLEKVNVYSLNADFRKQVKEKHELSYGIEAVGNKVTSTATKTNIYTGENITPVDTRYPNGGSKTTNIGVYLSHSWEINEMLILSDGIRFSHNSLISKFDTSAAVSNFQFPFTTVKQTNNALNGNLALIMMPAENVRFTILGSTGFRAPNVDDLSKVYESAGNTVVVPNSKLKAEYAYNIEGGLSTTVMDNKIKLEANYYYTLLKNAIVVKEFQFDGKDSLMFNGTLSQVKASQNVDEAYIQGLYGAITADFSDHVSFKTSLTYTLGQYHQQLAPLNNDPSHDTIVPLDHIPPMFGQTSILYHFKKFESEIYARYSAAKTGKDYSIGKEDNELYSADPVNGYMPGWITFNFKTAYHITEKISVNLGIENLFDTHYRVFASGISAPGRNIIASVRVKF